MAMTDDMRAEVNFVQVTWARAIKVWWSLMWRGLLFGALAGGVVGAILGAILTISGVDLRTIRMIGQIAGMILGIPVGVAVTKFVLTKRFSDFTIALIEEQLRLAD